MSDIDRQRVTAVQKLRELGLVWIAGAWRKINDADLQPEADGMHALFVRRADQLDGCAEGSQEETEFVLILDAIGAYEEKRWPLGKIPGAKS